MEHTVAAPSRARGYQSGTSRHIERADPEMVRLDACPPLPPRAIGPVACASTGIFSARAGNAAGPPRVHVHRPSSRAKSARGLRETPRFGPDRPRPPPTAPGPAPGARRPASHAAPRSPYPPSSPDAFLSARQETLAPSRASTDGPTPWSVTRGVVAGVAFGALVIAGGALVSTSSTEFGAEFGARLARLGSASARETENARVADADAFSLPSFERDARVDRPAVADLGRAAAEARRSEVFGGDGASADAWGAEKTRSYGALGAKRRTPRGRHSHEKTKKTRSLEGDAELLEATLAFAKPRPEDARERRARAAARKETATETAPNADADSGDSTLGEEDAVERASAAALSDLEGSDEEVQDEQDETLDDLFEPADGGASTGSGEDGADESLDALAAGAASEIGEARGEDAAADQPRDAPRDDEPEDAAPEDDAPEDSDSDSSEDSRAPNITPDMTYEEEQAEYARFAEEERARNEAVAAEAARRDAEAEAEAEAALSEEPVPSGADERSGANEAFEAETARRRAEFEAEEARRRAEFEANLLSGEAELGERLDANRSFANETFETFETEWIGAPSPEPSPFEDEAEDASYFTEGVSDEASFLDESETFAEAPGSANPDLNPEEARDVRDASDSSDSSYSDDLPFPYSLEAATPTVAPSEKEAILRAATHALGPALRETAAQALEAYAKRLREEADESDEAFSFPDASFASGEAVAEAIDESFEETVGFAYGANDENATTAFPATNAFPDQTETVFVEEPTLLSNAAEPPTEALAVAGIETDADVPSPFEEIEEPFAEPPMTTEDEAGFFQDAFAFAPAPAESFEEEAFAPAPAESGPPEEDALAFLLAEGADAAVPASPSVPGDPEVPTDSSEGVAAADGDDVSAVTQRLEAALGAASAARHKTKKPRASHARVAVGADGVIVREKHAKTKTANHKTSSSKAKTTDTIDAHHHKSRLTEAERARGWSAGDETAFRLKRSGSGRHHRANARPEGSLTAKRVRAVSSGDLSETLDAFEPAWATMGADERVEGVEGKRSGARLDLDPRATLEAEAAAAAAADEEALRVDTTLDAVQQAIADQRRDDAPAATLMLAPLSVVGVAGVVVIAILLVRHRDPRGARRDGPDGAGESASLLGGSGSRYGGGDVEAGESAADALVKTSNANLRALFGGVGVGESNVGRSIFATPSETDAESAAETETSVRKSSGVSANGQMAGEWSNGGGLFGAWNRARAALDSAERFSSSRVSALRASVQRTRRMVAAAAEGDDSALSAAPPRERAGGASPAAEVQSPASASPRGDPPASVLDVAGEVSEVAGAFSAAEMRRSAREEVGRLPPSSFADPVSAPGSPEHRAGVAAGTRGSGSPTSFSARKKETPVSETLISAEARRRFQQAAATSAHARAFAAPPAPHLAAVSAAGGGVSSGEADERRRAVMGAGRAVAPAPAGRPAMVKSTTRFL